MILFLLILIILDSTILSKTLNKTMVFFFVSVVDTVKLGIYFSIGCLLYLYRKSIPLFLPLVIFLLIVFLLSLTTKYANILGYLILPYLVIYFAYAINNSWTKNFGRFGDFSYGMYIYAFPIQQTIV